MKIEKFKVLLYLKKSGLDKNGKAPIMGRITVNRTMAQFSCKQSCTPSLWNPRASRLEGKSKSLAYLKIYKSKEMKMYIFLAPSYYSIIEVFIYCNTTSNQYDSTTMNR